MRRRYISLYVALAATAVSLAAAMPATAMNWVK